MRVPTGIQFIIDVFPDNTVARSANQEFSSGGVDYADAVPGGPFNTHPRSRWNRSPDENELTSAERIGTHIAHTIRSLVEE